MHVGTLGIRAVVGVAAAFALSLVLGVASAAANGHVGGYRVKASQASASTTFVVPSIDCTPVQPNGFQAVALGVRLGRPRGSSGAGVVVGCAPQPFLVPLVQINGVQQATTLNVQAGDTVAVSGSENSAGTSLVINVNGAGPQGFTGPGGTLQVAAVGDIAVNCLDFFGGVCSPVAKVLGPTTFTGSLINGTDLSSAHAVKSNLKDASENIQISAGRLASDGETFSTTWVSSCGFTAARC